MTITHHGGGCQCGAVRFEADLDLDQTATCNCSRCQKIGSVLTFTGVEQFTLLQGAENLTEYRFNKEVIAHQFCKTCGVQTHSRGKRRDGSAMVAVNCNALDDIDPRTLKSRHVDGRSF